MIRIGSRPRLSVNESLHYPHIPHLLSSAIAQFAEILFIVPEISMAPEKRQY